jgi:hypothetical protein
LIDFYLVRANVRVKGDLPMNKKLIEFIDSLTEEQIEKLTCHLAELSALCELHNQPCHQEQYQEN